MNRKDHFLLATLFLFCFINVSDAQICFLPVDSFDVGTNPRFLTTGDFNRDGKIDVATANNSTSNVSILLGDGMGGFADSLNFAVSGLPWAIICNDFNNDSIPDLSVAIHTNQKVSVLLGLGNGSFNPAIDFLTSYQGMDLCSADFDRDGNLDIAIANGSTVNCISVHFGDGSGHFISPGSNYSIGGSFPGSIITEDLNRDTIADLIISNPSANRISILLGNANGTFASASYTSVGSNPTPAICKDFNRDGFADLAVANSGNNSASVLLGNGIGGFGTPITTTLGFTPSGTSPGTSLISADFNTDSIPDLAISYDNTDSVSILLGTGNGNFTIGGYFAIIGKRSPLSFADFNGDGKEDIASAGTYSRNHVCILLNCNAPLGFTSIKENNNSLIISPNPATNIIKTSGVKEKTQLCLYDMFGKIILTTETEINVELDVSNLSQGVYTLLSASKSNQTYNKFVIIRE